MKVTIDPTQTDIYGRFLGLLLETNSLETVTGSQGTECDKRTTQHYLGLSTLKFDTATWCFLEGTFSLLLVYDFEVVWPVPFTDGYLMLTDDVTEWALCCSGY